MKFEFCKQTSIYNGRWLAT